MIDLDNYDLIAESETPSKCVLRDPRNNLPLDAYIMVLGPESEKHRNAYSKLLRKMSEFAAKAKEEGKEAELTPKENDRYNAEFLAEITTGWGEIAWKGNEFPFNEKNAILLYTKRPWIARQVELHKKDLRNFMNAGSQEQESTSSKRPGSTQSRKAQKSQD